MIVVYRRSLCDCLLRDAGGVHMSWLALFAIVALLVSGCGSIDRAEPEPKPTWYSISIPIGDAYTVICITNDAGDAISCNWDGVLSK